MSNVGRRYPLAPLDGATKRRILTDLREGDPVAAIARRWRQPEDAVRAIAVEAGLRKPTKESEAYARRRS